jgi:hypothetical protein
MAGAPGATPAGTSAQSPSELGRLHAWQVSPHRDEQQIPSEQKPDWHSPSQVQGSAFPFWRPRASDGQVVASDGLSSLPAPSCAPPPSALPNCAFEHAATTARTTIDHDSTNLDRS